MSRKPLDIPLSVWEQRRRLQRGGMIDPDTVEFEDGVRFYSFLPLACPNCDRVRWLKTNDYRKSVTNNIVCKSCHCHEIGKKGYAAFRARYSHAEWLEMMRKIQIDKPSSSELKAREILQEILPQGFEFLEQVISDNRIIDFVITANNGNSWVAFIEINGYWHRHNIKQAMRDQDLAFSSLIPVKFIDDRILFDPNGQLEFAQIINDICVHFLEVQNAKQSFTF